MKRVQENVIYHEAGHAFFNYLDGYSSVIVISPKIDKKTGMSSYCQRDKKIRNFQLYSRPEIFSKIDRLLAGAIAERQISLKKADRKKKKDIFLHSLSSPMDNIFTADLISDQEEGNNKQDTERIATILQEFSLHEEEAIEFLKFRAKWVFRVFETKRKMLLELVEAIKQAEENQKGKYPVFYPDEEIVKKWFENGTWREKPYF